MLQFSVFSQAVDASSGRQRWDAAYPGSSMEPQSPLRERGQLFSSLHACMHTQTDAHTHSGPPHIEAIHI